MASKAPPADGPDIATIRAAIETHCGGWKDAPEADVRAKWAKLSPELRAHYLKHDKPTPFDPPKDTTGAAKG